jgi:hypothetical protein
MRADELCPFDPTEPRCIECRGKPCGDFEKDMNVPGPRLPGPERFDGDPDFEWQDIDDPQDPADGLGR